MPQRGYVLVFFFWALLAIITPTLVFWSASAKPGFSSQGEEDVRGQKMVRRMMGYLEEKRLFLNRRGEEAPSPAAALAAAPTQTLRTAPDEAVEEEAGLVRPR